MQYMSPIIIDYNKYKPYSGRQIEYTVVPHYHPHYFFDGVQSVSATHNSSEYEHGQYTYPSDVIVEKNYEHTSGTVELKDFNNALYVLRGMAGMDPATSFMFDPTHLQPVEVFANVYDRDRSKVLRSTWLVDFLPVLTETENLDEIGVKTLDYKASRKLDFEGCQILTQEWMNTKTGDTDFTLFYPALINVRDHWAAMHGLDSHEFCPIPYTLRVIVGGEVLLNQDQAEIQTTADGDVVISTLHLKTPIGTPGTPVVVMWLATGEHLIGRIGLTIAPVMADIIPQGDWAFGGTGWDGTLEVYFSEALRDIDKLSIDSNNEFANFVLTAIQLDGAGDIVAQGQACPSSIGGASGGSPAKFETEPDALISRNKLVLNFAGSVGFSSLPSPIPVPPGNTLVWTLAYRSYLGNLPIKGEETDGITPPHVLDINKVS